MATPDALTSIESQATAAYSGWDTPTGPQNGWTPVGRHRSLSQVLKGPRHSADRLWLRYACGHLKTCVDGLKDGEVNPIGSALRLLSGETGRTR